MSNINYLRALYKAKCLSCNYEGYDADFEEYKSTKTGENQYMVDTIIKCPECHKHNTRVLLEEPLPPPEIIFLEEEDENYWKENEEDEYND